MHSTKLIMHPGATKEILELKDHIITLERSVGTQFMLTKNKTRNECTLKVTKRSYDKYFSRKKVYIKGIICLNN